MSRSDVQLQAEPLIVAAAAAALNVELLKDPAVTSIEVGGGQHVRVDAGSRDGSTVVEAYARQGTLKGGQVKKIAQDILKLSLIREHRAPTVTRTVIAFASEEARQSISGWVEEAARRFQVELLVVEVPQEMRQQIVAAQHRQLMVNIDSVADDLTVDLADS